MEVVRLPALSDNYIWLLKEPTSGKTAVVDPAETGPVFSELKSRCAPAPCWTEGGWLLFGGSEWVGTQTLPSYWAIDWRRERQGSLRAADAL
jgi:hypothetical protein